VTLASSVKIVGSVLFHRPDVAAPVSAFCVLEADITAEPCEPVIPRDASGIGWRGRPHLGQQAQAGGEAGGMREKKKAAGACWQQVRRFEPAFPGWRGL
jgi:hypothetical protein